MNKLILILIIILAASNVFLAVRYFSVFQALRQTQTAAEAQNINVKVLEFAKLFIKEVLEAKTEVSFETRLKLENAVRNLNDEEILNQ